MAETDGRGKVELKIGEMSFSGEGDQVWLDDQISKLLEAATSDEIRDVISTGANASEERQSEPTRNESLPTYLRNKGGEKSQVKRFLATATWLYRRGETNLTTRLVGKALRENHQKRLGNPSDCLNKNVSKGHCEKTAGGFFITPDGWNALGEQQ